MRPLSHLVLGKELDITMGERDKENIHLGWVSRVRKAGMIDRGGRTMRGEGKDNRCRKSGYQTFWDQGEQLDWRGTKEKQYDPSVI